MLMVFSGKCKSFVSSVWRRRLSHLSVKMQAIKNLSEVIMINRAVLYSRSNVLRELVLLQDAGEAEGRQRQSSFEDENTNAASNACSSCAVAKATQATFEWQVR